VVRVPWLPGSRLHLVPASASPEGVAVAMAAQN
jgi:hypothetical protein